MKMVIAFRYPAPKAQFNLDVNREAIASETAADSIAVCEALKAAFPVVGLSNEHALSDVHLTWALF